MDSGLHSSIARPAPVHKALNNNGDGVEGITQQFQFNDQYRSLEVLSSTQGEPYADRTPTTGRMTDSIMRKTLQPMLSRFLCCV